MKILSADLEFTYPAADDFEESTRRLRSCGWGTDNIDDELKKYLDKHLLKRPKDKEGVYFYSQFNETAKQMAQRVAQYSKSCGESSSQFEHRLYDAFDVLKSIRYATNEKTHWSRSALERAEVNEEEKAEVAIAEHTIWYHGEALLAFQAGYESEYARKVEVDSLQENARKYLLRPWIENETLEWIIVDALAFSAVTSFGEGLKKQSPGGLSWLLGLNLAYFSAKGNVGKMAWKRIQYGLTKFAAKVAIFLAAPIALGWYFWNRGGEDEVVIAGAVYAGLVSLYLAYRLLRWMLGKTPQSGFEKHEDVLADMFVIYDSLEGEVISSTFVRDRLLDTARRGAVWPGAVFSRAFRFLCQRDVA